MNQTRLQSLIESLINTFLGFFISWMAMAFLIPLLFPLSGVTASNSFWITSVFTVISVIRNYAVRRWFNHILHRWSGWLAEEIDDHG